MTRAAILLFALAGLAGCYERKITILSSPEGALVHVNNVEVGRTPVTFPFTWYGDYEIVLRYEKEEPTPNGPVRRVYFKHTHERAKAPPGQWMGVDLITELLPFQFEDHKTWAFVLDEVPAKSDQDLIRDATALKAQLVRPEDFPKRPPSKGHESGALPEKTPATTTSQPATQPRKQGSGATTIRP